MAARKEIRIDIEKCTGCRHCETACSLKHSKEGIVNPKLSRIRVFTDFDREIAIPIISGPYTRTMCTSRNRLNINGRDYESCLFCRAACPTRPFFIDPESKTPLKCDLCGYPPDPSCVKACVHGALTLVEVEEEEETAFA